MADFGCAACDEDADCTALATSHCNTDTSTATAGTCIECTQDSHCATGTIDTSLDQCLENLGCAACDEDADCTASATSHCNTDINTATAGMCIECTEDIQCAPTNSEIDASLTQCMTGVGCVMCDKDIHCNTAATSRCDTTSHMCVGK